MRMTEMLAEIADMQRFLNYEFRDVDIEELRGILTELKEAHDESQIQLKIFLAVMLEVSPKHMGALVSMGLVQAIVNRLIESGDVEEDL